MKKKILFSMPCILIACAAIAQGDCSTVSDPWGTGKDPYGYCNATATTAGTVGNLCSLGTCATLGGAVSTCITTCTSTSNVYSYTVTIPFSCFSGAGKTCGPVTGFSAYTAGGIIESAVVTLANDTKPSRTLPNSGCSSQLDASANTINYGLYLRQIVFKIHWTTAATNNEVQVFLYSQQDQGYSGSTYPNYLTYYLSQYVNTFSGVPATPPVINVSSPSWSPCGWHIGTANMTDAYDYMWSVTSGNVLSNTSPYLESMSYGTGPIVHASQTVSANVYTRNGCGVSGIRYVSGLSVPAPQCGGGGFRSTESIGGNAHMLALQSPVVYASPGAHTIIVTNPGNTVKQITVYSAIGVPVKKTIPGAGSTILNMDHTSPGVYIVRLQLADGSYNSQKVFVQ